jgi:hypothetical protein
MKIYLLSLFYSDLKSVAALVKNIRSDVESIAGSNWRVVSPGAQTCAILFGTDISLETIRARFHKFDESSPIAFLLVEVEAVAASFLTTDTKLWMARLMAQKST